MTTAAPTMTETETVTSSLDRITISGLAQTKSQDAPPPLNLDLSKYPKLTRAQAGHLRHFHNLVSALDGEWPHMGTQEPAQEFLDAFRYQLATINYAAGAAYYHRLPALRSPLKTLMRQSIRKMLHRAVWGYWYLSSQSGSLVDPDLKELRKPWADPVVRENIMYSGHLLLMTSLYEMLFDDDEFAKPGALTFNWDPVFFGFGPDSFAYDNRSLQAVIEAEMERNGWMGVCCEPNQVFIVCNQFPLIAIRYNDSRDGTDRISGILDKYMTAWQKKQGGMRGGQGGFYRESWMVKQDRYREGTEWAFSTWANAFMNAWNADFCQHAFTEQSLGFVVKKVDGYVMNAPEVGIEFRRLVADGADPESSSTQAQAVAVVKEQKIENAGKPKFPYTKPFFGYAIECLSELGRKEELDGLLDYADTRLRPTWERGGLYYPREDKPTDEELNWINISPFCGNTAIGYARLNVPDGQKLMWEKPLTREAIARAPYIDGITYADGVDFLRAAWDEVEQAMVVTMRTWQTGDKRSIALLTRNLPEGRYGIYINGVCTRALDPATEVAVNVSVTDEEVDVILKLLS